MNDGSGRSVESLLAEADILEIGVVRWGMAVPLDVPGVYVVALTDDTSRTNATLPGAPLGDRALTELLERCDDLRVDGQRPSRDELGKRIGSFWLSNETTLYVGKAGTSLRNRVNQYYKTPLGARSPHAGGWFLKTLANLNELFVHFGASDNPEEAERRILEAFIASIPPVTDAETPYWDLTLPFANLQLPGGRRKSHRITGATGCGQSKSTERSKNPPESGAASSQQGKTTLHEEIGAILKANGNRWMTTSEIAFEVQQRCNYKKRDGTSDVTPYQVHGRTKNYPHLFERDGSRVRLLDTAGP